MDQRKGEHEVGRAAALEAAALAKVDVLLAGHLHASSHRRISEDPGLGMLVVQAGTATSHRRSQREPNTFNVVRVDGHALAVELWTAGAGTFTGGAPRRFQRTSEGWRMA